MAQGQHLFVLTTIAIVLLMVLSKCNSYPWLHELTAPERPMKFHSANEVSRYNNRKKQYYDTMAHLRYWRRDIDESNDAYDDTLQEMLQQYNDLQYKR